MDSTRKLQLFFCFLLTCLTFLHAKIIMNNQIMMLVAHYLSNESNNDVVVEETASACTTTTNNNNSGSTTTTTSSSSNNTTIIRSTTTTSTTTKSTVSTPTTNNGTTTTTTKTHDDNSGSSSTTTAASSSSRIVVVGSSRKRKAPKEWMSLQSRTESWYDNVLMKSDDGKWMEHLRLPQHAVDSLCGELKELAPSNIIVRAPVPLKKRVCIALFKLATNAEYRVVAERFGVSKTTIHRCLYHFCEAMFRRRDRYIPWYTLEEAKQLAQDNRVKFGYPQAIGAIDVTHVSTTPPSGAGRNRKHSVTMVLQAAVDPNLKFRDVFCNIPDSANTASVFHQSPLASLIVEKMPKDDVVFDNVAVPLHLLANSAYPSSPQVIKSFTGRNLTAEQESFNVYHGDTRTCALTGLGRLKSRWQVLRKRLEVDHSLAPMVVTTCCILHNMCEDLKTTVPSPLDEKLSRHPPKHDMTVDEEADSIRQAILRHLAQNYHLHTSFNQ